MNVLSIVPHLGPVLPPLAEGFEPSSLALPGGVVGAAVIIITTLIKFRSTDRQDLSKDTQEFIDKIITERNNAQAALDTVRKQASKDQTESQMALDEERCKRRGAEDRAAEAERHLRSYELRDQGSGADHPRPHPTPAPRDSGES